MPLSLPCCERVRPARDQCPASSAWPCVGSSVHLPQKCPCLACLLHSECTAHVDTAPSGCSAQASPREPCLHLSPKQGTQKQGLPASAAPSAEQTLQARPGHGAQSRFPTGAARLPHKRTPPPAGTALHRLQGAGVPRCGCHSAACTATQPGTDTGAAMMLTTGCF